MVFGHSGRQKAVLAVEALGATRPGLSIPKHTWKLPPMLKFCPLPTELLHSPQELTPALTLMLLSCQLPDGRNIILGCSSAID